MVEIPNGFYFCHGFDLGVRPVEFSLWHSRESGPIAPLAVRYVSLEIDGVFALLGQLGFLIIFQPVANTSELKDAIYKYDNEFDIPYDSIYRKLKRMFGARIIGETSSLVEIGASNSETSWNTVNIPNVPHEICCLIEAMLVDSLCRSLERHSNSFASTQSIADERRLVEFAEGLFPLSHPAGYLVSHLELEVMNRYYTKWGLADRVVALRTKFTESVSNSTFYRGKLERNRQGTMNTALAAIAFLSLSGVSKSLSSVLHDLSLPISSSSLDKAFSILAVLILIYGVWRYLVKPTVSIFLDNWKRRQYSWKVERFCKK